MKLRNLISLALMCACSASPAYQVLPKVSDVDRKLATHSGSATALSIKQFFVAGIAMLKGPVHESITLAALDCQINRGSEADCVTLDRVRKHQMVLYGVRWPDDPPFLPEYSPSLKKLGCLKNVTIRSTAQPDCWLGLFKAAGKEAMSHTGTAPAFGPGTMILYRTHFGDLQFLHSMGAVDGESASETKSKMKMWAEYLWGIAIGSLPSDEPIKSLGVKGLDYFFPGDMTTSNLLATGIIEPRDHLDEVAIGALLHMVQDSFSGAHTKREQSSGGKCSRFKRFESPGRIAEFYGYAKQNSSLHDDEDTSRALSLHTVQNRPSVVQVSSDFFTLWRERRSWAEVEPFFECTFALANPNITAGPGPFRSEEPRQSRPRRRGRTGS
jgi:hypothetical protein